MQTLEVEGKIKDTNLIDEFLCKSIRMMDYWRIYYSVKAHETLSLNNEYRDKDGNMLNSPDFRYSGFVIEPYLTDVYPAPSFPLHVRDDTGEIISAFMALPKSTENRKINRGERIIGGYLSYGTSAKLGNDWCRDVERSLLVYFSRWFDYSLLNDAVEDSPIYPRKHETFDLDNRDEDYKIMVYRKFFKVDANLQPIDESEIYGDSNYYGKYRDRPLF